MDSTDIDLTKALEDRYADLIYDNEDLSSIIKDLANKYGVDVVMTATPTDRITLRVRGVNIEDAFELVFAGSQFGYTRKDDTFIVYSTTNKNFGLDRKTILFPLKYLEAQQAQKLLPAEIKDKVQISETQNAFIASGSKMELTQLYDFIRTIDRPIPQVEFNVQLVEVSRDFSRSVGLLQDQFSLGKIGNLTGGTGLNFGWNSTFNEENTAIFKNRPTYNQSSGTSQIKVNQRLLVTSGKSAKINFDEDRNILLNAGSSTGQNIGVVQQQNIQRITAGNSMDITPVVGGGGVVTVKVEVEVSANNDINNDTGIPRTTVRRRLSSVIQITDNETIAIGGLFDNRKSLGNKNELPLVSRLPVIGQLFTSQGSKNKNLKELIILITPHIKTGEEKEQVYIQAEGGI
jgi:type II secretory pathway component GspD/PulD (secretin)